MEGQLANFALLVNPYILRNPCPNFRIFPLLVLSFYIQINCKKNNYNVIGNIFDDLKAFGESDVCEILNKNVTK